MSEFTLSKQRLTRLIGHDKIKGKKHRSHLYCPVCGAKFEIGDKISVDGKVLVHSECMPLFRIDVSDDGLDEIDAVLIENPEMLSNKEKLRIIKEKTIPE